MTVYVLIYDHRNGTDVSLYATPLSAWEAAAAIASDFADELEPATAEAVRNFVAEGRYEEAVDTYCLEHEDEDIVIEPKEINA